MPAIDFPIPLVGSSKLNLIGVDNNNIVTNVGGLVVDRLVLSLGGLEVRKGV